MFSVITREDAFNLHATHYFTGKQCRNGHVAQRYVSTGTCVRCATMYNEKNRNVYIERREGVVMLRNVTVPRKHLKAIMSMVGAYMAMEGLLPGPPPEETQPVREMTVDEAREARMRITGQAAT